MSWNFRKTFTLNASVKDAFLLLTDARKIRAWSSQKGGVQPKIGGRFALFDGWVKGVVLAYQPGKRLAMTWLPNDWEAGTEPSIVTYAFAGKGTKTRVTLVHKNLPNARAAAEHRSGWDEFVIEPLKQYLEVNG